MISLEFGLCLTPLSLLESDSEPCREREGGREGEREGEGGGGGGGGGERERERERGREGERERGRERGREGEREREGGRLHTTHIHILHSHTHLYITHVHIFYTHYTHKSRIQVKIKCVNLRLYVHMLCTPLQ